MMGFDNTVLPAFVNDAIREWNTTHLDSKPKSANFVIMGTIAYDGDARERTIGTNTPINLTGAELDAFLDNIAQGNIQDAYQQLFSAYRVPGMAMQDDSEIDIDINLN